MNAHAKKNIYIIIETDVKLLTRFSDSEFRV